MDGPVNSLGRLFPDSVHFNESLLVGRQHTLDGPESVEKAAGSFGTKVGNAGEDVHLTGSLPMDANRAPDDDLSR